MGSLIAIYCTLYILCETGCWCCCSSCCCPAATTCAAESLSISSPWACLWVDPVAARLKIKPLTRRLYLNMYLLSISIPPPDYRGGPDARLCDDVSVFPTRKLRPVVSVIITPLEQSESRRWALIRCYPLLFAKWIKKETAFVFIRLRMDQTLGSGLP